MQEELLRNRQVRENVRRLLSALESDRKLRLGSVARQYAMLLNSGGAEQVDFPHLNSVIAQRWSDTGLIKVKNWAWQIVFRIEQSSRTSDHLEGLEKTAVKLVASSPSKSPHR